MQYLRWAWRGISGVSTLAWILSLGAGGLVTTAVSRIVSLETPWNVVFFASLFLVASALLVPMSRLVLARLGDVGAPAREPHLEVVRDRAEELRTIRTIRGEVDEGVRIVERAIGVNQVFEVVGDLNWFAHRNVLAGIAEAGDGYRLASIAWEGFRKYNDVVKGRRFISNEDLEQIARDGKRAVDALGVAADNLRLMGSV